MIQISKSEFLDYRSCAKGWWLKHRKPHAVSRPSPSAFDRMLMADGYAVEAEAKKLVATWPHHDACTFQRIFDAGTLYARADLVHDLGGGTIDLYEIKGSTSLKSSSGGQDHVDDACFQTLVAERAGVTVRAVYIMHVNGEYTRAGAVDPAELLVIIDVTSEVRARSAGIGDEIEAAITLIATNAIDERGCTCRHIGKASHCASFGYFNPEIPENSAYLLPRISRKRLETLDGEQRLAIDHITEKDVTPAQLPIWRALASREPLIDRTAIGAFLEPLRWPLHFYDYETFAAAVPIADGHRPQQAMPVQFSLHRLAADGRLDHAEFLADGPGQQAELVAALGAAFADEGSAIVWNKSFEKGCNDRMADLLPDAAAFLEGINERIVDLMDPFKAHYVHPGFGGSTSIKKVLPILCPDLHYDPGAVHDGAGAMEAWIRMVETSDPAERTRLATELKDYCRLDSLAMVEIFQVLRAL
jgi:hypothetical protein